MRIEARAKFFSFHHLFIIYIISISGSDNHFNISDFRFHTSDFRNIMNAKDKRHEVIRAILENRSGSTQEEIKEILESRNIYASQSTLSRDLREMGAVKIPLEEGGAKYMLASAERGGLGLGEIGRAVQNFTVDFEPVGNFLVIRTTAGNAQALCVILDRQKWHEIVGTIAGDDTILVIARTGDDIKSVVSRLEQSVKEETV
jgi:transcriptional regulator of arginine metabolism